MIEPLIVEVIHRYHPNWVAPKNTTSSWAKTKCPFHGDENPSASVSYVIDAFVCHACGVKGTARTIVNMIEGVTFAEADRIVQAIFEGGGGTLPPKPAKVSRRRLFGDEGAGVPFYFSGAGREVQDRVRRRPFTGA